MKKWYRVYFQTKADGNQKNWTLDIQAKNALEAERQCRERWQHSVYSYMRQYNVHACQSDCIPITDFQIEKRKKTKAELLMELIKEEQNNGTNAGSNK